MNILSADSAKREVKTGHHTYVLETVRDGHTLLSGHPQYCPEAVEVNLMRPLQPGSPLMVSPPRSRSSAHLAHQRDPRVMSHGQQASGLTPRFEVIFLQPPRLLRTI